MLEYDAIQFCLYLDDLRDFKIAGFAIAGFAIKSRSPESKAGGGQPNFSRMPTLAEASRITMR